ncbi:phage tail tape measure protein [uncultured Sanguibacteroides sp.]|uniref:phage tail tape measure protein n=1 Tax=uncultured Sanguibacteroides sp. TaxID=1635151 RepID=UPI0025F3999C|nr:phage tail tape measure protein [uncultured Sanguibacteroides sp.]
MAKRIVDEDMVLNIIINGDKGKSELLKLERSIKDLNVANEGLANKMASVKQKMDDLQRAGKGNSVEYKDLRVELNQLQNSFDSNSRAIDTAKQRMENIRKGMDITKMSVTDLRREITRLTRLRNTAGPGTEQWKNFDAQLVKVQKRLAEVTRQGKSTQSILCRMADGINKYWNFVVSGLASLTGVFLGIKSAINKYVEFTDVLADVRKTTGLTETGVLQLNDALRKIDTRSSQEELMGLARIGGKLGIEGKENLEGFVRAADKINIALKEDLGGDVEESIRQVGKLVDIFKLKDDFGIEQALLKVGSVINELGAASTANEGYLVEFTKRVAGVAPSIGISVDQVMGLAATLDQLGQTAEVSSTVFSKLVSGMFKNTAEYAKVAGMSVTDFSNLMKMDANEALIRLFDGLKGNNSEMQKLVANMGNIGMDNVRAVSVMGALANNTKLLREQQALANKSFVEGISLTEEFNIKNNNLAAIREKAKNQLNERIKLLGEKLQPLMISGMNAMSILVKVLGALLSFFSKYGSTLVKLTVIYLSYLAVQKLSVKWTKAEGTAISAKIILDELSVFWTKAKTAATYLLIAAQALLIGKVQRAMIAWKAFNRVIGTNPYALLIAGIVALGFAIATLVKRKTEWQKSMERIIAIEKEFNKEVAMEQRTLDDLFGNLQNAKEGTKEWERARREITDKYGGYLENLNLEISTLDDAEKAYRALSKSIKDAAMDKALSQAREKAVESLIDTELKNLEKIKRALSHQARYLNPEGAFEELRKQLDSGGEFSEHMKLVIKTAGLEDGIKEIRDARKIYEQEMARIKELFTSPVDKSGGKGGGNTKEVKPRNLDEEIVLLKEKYAKQLIDKKAYEEQLDKLELEHLRYRLANEAQTEADRVKLRGQIADKMVEIATKQKKVETSTQKEYVDTVLASAESAVFKENKAFNNRLRQAGIYGKNREKLTDKELKALEIMEKEHQENLKKIDKDTRKKRSDDYMKEVNIKIKNLETAHSIEMAQLKVQQNEELSNFSGTLFQRKELQKRYQLEAIALTESQVNEMMDLVSGIFVDLGEKEFDLGKKILTDEEKLQLQRRIDTLKATLAEMGVEVKDLTASGRTDFDLLGMTSSKWEEFFSNLEKGKIGINDLEFAANALSNAWDTYNKLRNEQGKKELKQYETKTKKEKAALNAQLDSGQISQEQYNARVSQLDADLDTKREELQQKQAERERKQALFSTILSTAVGIAKAWELGPIVGPIMAALVAAMGAVQIATIQAAQYAKGKYPVVGDDDGRLYQAEYAGDNLKTGVYEKATLGLFSEKEPEMVVDGATTRKLIFDYPLIYKSIMDISHGRVPQYDDGKYPTATSSVSSDIMVVGSDPEIRQLLQENIRMMKILANKEIVFKWYGSGGFKEKLDKSNMYDKNTSIGR